MHAFLNETICGKDMQHNHQSQSHGLAGCPPGCLRAAVASTGPHLTRMRKDVLCAVALLALGLRAALPRIGGAVRLEDRLAPGNLPDEDFHLDRPSSLQLDVRAGYVTLAEPLEARPTIALWHGCTHRWSDNHRLNRLGDDVCAPSCDSVLTECTAVVGHGSGEHVVAAGSPRPQMGGKP